MSRVWADRIFRTLLALLAASVLWVFVYEVTVGARYRKSDPTEGASRWALIRAQFADRDFSTFGWKTVLLGPSHFWMRVQYPATQEETLKRGGFALVFVGAAGLALAIVLKVNGPAKHKGDAQFGSLLDAAKRRLTGRRGLILGKMNGTVIRNADPAHILMIAPSRSGKGSGFIVPNGYDHDGSFVFWDTKRENFDILSRYLRDKGVKVFLFRPGGTQSHRYNPLDFVRRDENMPTDCAVVASFLVPERADDTWSGAARMLLATLIGYVLASRNCEGSRHLRGVARMTVTGRDISVVLKTLVRTEGQMLPRWVVDGFNQYVALEPETRNSAVFNVNMAMNPWNNPLISSATETSDFDLREFRRERMAVFVACSIPELVQFRPIIRIFFQQVHDLLMDRRPGPDERFEVLIALDEFYHLGPMHSLLTKITISAGYKFRMAIMIQNMAQLDELYGKPLRQSTLAGSQVKLFLAIDDLETANYLSEMLGDTTVKVTTPIRRAGGGVFAPAGENVHYEAKALRSAQELREMPEREAILIVRSARPFLLRVFRHYEDSPFKEIYARYGEIPVTVPVLERWEDRDMGVILQGSGNSDAPAKSIEGREARSQKGETPPQAAVEAEQIAPAHVEEKKPFATPVLTSVEMMQLDDGKNFNAFLESEKQKTKDPEIRARFDKLIAEIDEVGDTIVGLPAPVPAE
ncbi:MAG: type IV secretory system conjugative DNA transfer family protein [Roseiarcus sp.]